MINADTLSKPVMSVAVLNQVQEGEKMKVGIRVFNLEIPISVPQCIHWVMTGAVSPAWTAHAFTQHVTAEELRVWVDQARPISNHPHEIQMFKPQDDETEQPQRPDQPGIWTVKTVGEA